MGRTSEIIIKILSLYYMGYKELAKTMIKCYSEQLHDVKYYFKNESILRDINNLMNNTDDNLTEKDELYRFSDISDISRKVWYFNFMDESIHFFTYPGCNLHFLRTGDQILVLDCGTIPSDLQEFVEIELSPFLHSKGYSENMIKGVLLSHSHYDHYSLLGNIRSDIPIYLTKETYDLIFLTNRRFLEEKNIKVIEYDKEFECGIFRIKAMPSGHILGSAAFDIRFKGKRLFYTGDFSVHNQMLMHALDLREVKKDKIDYLVCEHTYGVKDFAIEYEDAARCLAYAIDYLVGLGIKTIIPAFAIGRAQEVLNVISRFCKTKPKVLVDGLARDITFYYTSKLGNFLSYNISLLCTDDISKLTDEFDVIVVSSGMLQAQSKAAKYLSYLRSLDFGFIKTGFIEERHFIHETIKALASASIQYFDISLSAHSNYFELVHTLKSLSPDVVILVHGNGFKGL